MPALPNAPKVIRIEFFMNVGLDTTAKCRRFHQYTGNAPTNGDLNGLASAVATFWGANIAPLMSVDSELKEIIITDLTSPTAAQGSNPSVIPGTRAGEPPSADACVLASQQIARRFRGGHPRTYWPLGTVNDLLNAQEWTTAFVTACQNGLDTLTTGTDNSVWAGGGVLSPCAVSYYDGFTVHTGTTGRARNVSTVRLAPVIDAVLDEVVRQFIASQRKRLLRGA